ncbi:DUF3772 domain-containing protein [Lentibacter algarum]|uniref:DUF3772 domain-containing protein n=1 Tax=Lentibacter algarum TaxID=576131 RepID=UPI001C0754BF|nr:DUF3772 domain-containing protein [Lentibacter algarum]
MLLTFGTFGAAQAQSTTAVDYTSWVQLAERIETAVEAGRASDTVLQGLRDDLSGWREQFVTASEANARTLTAVRAQLTALGTVPEGGEEPADISAQRAELSSRLAELAAPGKRAEIAKSRADVLIGEIDSILRDRQTSALLERDATPLNPTLWTRGWTTLVSSLNGTKNELLAGWNNPVQRAAFVAKLPALIASTIVGLVLLLMGGRWILALGDRFLEQRSTAQRWLMAFVLSLGQLFVPLAGAYILRTAIYETEFVGLRLDPVLDAIFGGIFLLLVSLWIGRFVFSDKYETLRRFSLSSEQRRTARRLVGWLSVVVGVKQVLEAFASFDQWIASVSAVIYFPLIVISGMLLWRLGRLLRKHARQALAQSEEEQQPRYGDTMYGLLGRGLIIVGYVGPALAALGYLQASTTLVFKTIETLLLLVLVIIAQRVLAEVWVVIRRGQDGAREGLVPTLVGFGVMLMAVPSFFRIWGTSNARIEQFWTQLSEGVAVGDTRITASALITLAVVFAVGYMLTRLVQGALKNTVLPKTGMDKGGQSALVSGIGYVGIFLAALVAITSAGIDLSSLAIVAGALSVGIGFGLQNIVSNFVSGIILLIERPITEGDWIEVGGTHGTVRDISVRSTRIETFDRSDVILPNADLISGKVTNYTRGNPVGRVIVPVGVAYGNDTRKIEAILLEIAEAHPMVLAKPAPYVVFQGFGADSLDFEIRAILRDVNFVMSVRSDMNHEIARRFTEAKIEIPFAQRDIWLRNPEALAATGTPEPTKKPAKKRKPQVKKPDFSQLDEGDFDGTEGGER